MILCDTNGIMSGFKMCGICIMYNLMMSDILETDKQEHKT